MVLGLLVFEATVHRHQLYFRLHNNLKEPPFSIIFQGITRQHLDLGVLPCLKYFINFFFYKFGLEVPLRAGPGCALAAETCLTLVTHYTFFCRSL